MMNLLEENILLAIVKNISFGFMAGLKIGGPGDPGIQEAVKQASEDDTLIIRSGVAHIEWAGQLTINKSLHFTSEDIVLHPSEWLDAPLDDTDMEDAPILHGPNPSQSPPSAPGTSWYTLPPASPSPTRSPSPPSPPRQATETNIQKTNQLIITYIHTYIAIHS
jgi:hypothetical protein